MHAEMTALMTAQLYSFLAGITLFGFGVCVERSTVQVAACFLGSLVLLKFLFDYVAP